ncbi:unnamed protein product [Rhodiola kirilowii]
MEVSLDLCNHNALPSMVVRGSVRSMCCREIFGKSTFKLGVFLMKWFPVRIVDKILLKLGRMVLSDIEKYGLKRPSIGPLELKNTQGKTPVLEGMPSVDGIQCADESAVESTCQATLISSSRNSMP